MQRPPANRSIDRGRCDNSVSLVPYKNRPSSFFSSLFSFCSATSIAIARTRTRKPNKQNYVYVLYSVNTTQYTENGKTSISIIDHPVLLHQNWVQAPGRILLAISIHSCIKSIDNTPSSSLVGGGNLVHDSKYFLDDLLGICFDSVALHWCVSLCVLIRDNRRVMDLPYGIPKYVRLWIPRRGRRYLNLATEYLKQSECSVVGIYIELWQLQVTTYVKSLEQGHIKLAVLRTQGNECRRTVQTSGENAGSRTLTLASQYYFIG